MCSKIIYAILTIFEQFVMMKKIVQKKTFFVFFQKNMKKSFFFGFLMVHDMSFSLFGSANIGRMTSLEVLKVFSWTWRTFLGEKDFGQFHFQSLYENLNFGHFFHFFSSFSTFVDFRQCDETTIVVTMKFFHFRLFAP